MSNYSNIVSQFSKKKILVIGDSMLDVYVNGTSNRLCREAPVPIVAVDERKEAAGGGANTACNVASLGATTYFLSICGDDIEGSRLTEILSEKNVDTSYLIKDPHSRTLTKSRISSESHLLVRYDYGFVTPSKKIEERILQALEELYPSIDAVIVSDYAYGVVTENVISTLENLQRQYHKIFSVDSKRLPLFAKLSPTLVKPNYAEAVELLKAPKYSSDADRLSQIQELGPELKKYTQSQIAAITLDTLGALIFTDSLPPYRTYAKPMENSHAAGAGDTYISMFTLALTTNSNYQRAADLASLATSIVVSRDGTTLCTLEDITSSYAEDEKIYQLKDLLTPIEQLKKAGKKLVFTNGCFDILHRGHVAYLQEAKKRGDILVLGINSDESVRRLKGPTRPVNTLEDRMIVLSGLASIDFIVPFSENTPIHLIKILKPDIYVKGGDYTRETLPETPIVESYGGRVEIIPFVLDKSTTGIINKIKQQPTVPHRKDQFVQL